MTQEDRQAERGTTLIELLVVMVVFTALMGLVYGVLGQVQAQTAGTQRRADSVDQARLGLSQIDRHVRSGNVLYDPVSETLPLSMRVFTQANGARRCVQWQVYRPPATPATVPECCATGRGRATASSPATSRPGPPSPAGSRTPGDPPSARTPLPPRQAPAERPPARVTDAP
jgi:prepilin-type N-terminal cleavage/methylation domain-containing protein